MGSGEKKGLCADIGVADVQGYRGMGLNVVYLHAGA